MAMYTSEEGARTHRRPAKTLATTRKVEDAQGLYTKVPRNMSATLQSTLHSISMALHGVTLIDDTPSLLTRRLPALRSRLMVLYDDDDGGGGGPSPCVCEALGRQVVGRVQCISCCVHALLPCMSLALLGHRFSRLAPAHRNARLPAEEEKKIKISSPPTGSPPSKNCAMVYTSRMGSYGRVSLGEYSERCGLEDCRLPSE